MENSVANKESSAAQLKPQRGQISAGVPYPIDTIENVIQVAKELVSEHGTGRPITKEEIAKALNRNSSGLSLYYSTLVHYGIFNTVHGKGYAPTELFRKYMNPVHDGDEHRFMMEMFKKPSLYSKIIEHQNGHVLPTDAKRFGNMLKDDPYNVTEYAAEKAAKVFLDNAKSLGLLDGTHTFRIDGASGQTKAQAAKPDKDENKHSNPPMETDLFELPIPLSGGRKAKLFYPLDKLTKKDIRVIAKALAFIASTVLDEEEAEEAEREINREVLGK